ncbi:uncharacterized protein [Rutidosis leptorrhynchoides]|uniref:uncharacterized protein n=1 Tax=Rutidosis leptorrhynchoides TaxID=125765 RepID=UPI003A99A657
MGLISVINKRLNGTSALDLLRRTFFGSWLSLRLDTNEGALIHLILQMQVPLKANHDPLVDSLIYDVGGFRVKFGAKEFCLITGFRFGEEKWRPLKPKVLPFRQRVFSHVKIGLVESLQEWNSYPWGTHFWIHTHGKLKDVVPKSREKHLATPKCKKISYSLAGFIWAFQIWIFEAFPLSQKYFIKDKSILPRGVQCISNLSFGPNQHKKFLGPFLDDEIPRATLKPTTAEANTDWWLCSMESFGVVDHHPPRRRFNNPPLSHVFDPSMHNKPPPSVDVPTKFTPLMYQEFYTQLFIGRTFSLEQDLYKTKLEVASLKNQVGQHSVGQHNVGFMF